MSQPKRTLTGLKEIPELTAAVEQCFRSIGPDVDSARTLDGRPVYDYNLGVVNHSEAYLLAGFRRAIERVRPQLADYEIQWRQRPKLRAWTENGHRHLCIYMRFATDPILSTPLDFDPIKERQ